MSVICKQCGSVDDFRTEQKANNNCAFCNTCGTFIKNIPTDVPRMYVGKFKGKAIQDIDDLQYLKWAYDNMTALNARQKDAVKDRVYSLENMLK